MLKRKKKNGNKKETVCNKRN